MLLLLLTALVLLGLPACRIADVRLYDPPQDSSAPPFEVEAVRDIPYCEGTESDPIRHRIDLFLPRGLKDYPTVVLIHGGCWVVGNNRCSGLYTSVGEFLASQGIAAALPNYRLAPQFKHPEQIKDVARAFAWVHHHIADHGGCAERIFIAGHSAGGHLAALLATDERYLQAEGLTTADIKGVISLSGVYDLPEGGLEVTFGGTTGRAFHLDSLLPLRGVCEKSCTSLPDLPGIPLRVNIFSPAFGDDVKVRADASPRKHVRPGLPPFLLFCAERDLPHLPGMAQAFCKALREQGCAARLVKVAGRNHNSLMFHAITPDDPVAREMVAFIRAHTRIPPPGQPSHDDASPASNPK
jgi:acetyl esterase/lipase